MRVVASMVSPGGAGSELAPEGPIQHRREERVQHLRRPDLVSLEPVNLGLEIVEAGDDAALFVEGGIKYLECL